ncbi:WD40 repeat domain-containing protein [Bartonella tamiae]|uniref:Anaphase-promoting complex subunit 4 WD40 domain-containing protein n=1 Tax=Bartonella tamiae Th239 TaxID=1094558 RepID=J0ZLS1_9HYPH|nr:WD40 repeat domain-containing protein [Bartonella tamiae]EJF89373.1 hypothetical protein ME5_01924 [Bartonella tamiae Th239]EJF92762.1 hypothetical protein MEG_01932 [Bartonella tamiae Th307]
MPTLVSLELDSHCLSAGFINDLPYFVTANGQIQIIGRDTIILAAHHGIASVALSDDKQALFTGGEDGYVYKTLFDGTSYQLAQCERKWITSIASGSNGSYAFASSRKAWVDIGMGLREYDFERSVEGLVFAPKGQRVAIARYNGVSLYWPALEVEPTELAWKGAHFAVTFSPDNRFVISAMQENALHGWRLSDNQHLRMSGYPTKVKSWSWSTKGKWLATSGAMAAIVWPFQSKDGPMGKAPLELGKRANAMVTCVSCHPEEEMVAVGYDDGMILFVRFADAKEVLLRHPGKGAISALNWDQNGHRLAYGSEVGEAGFADITA